MTTAAKREDILLQHPMLQTKFKPLARYLASGDVLEIWVNRPGEVVVLHADNTVSYHEEKELTLQNLELLAGALAQMNKQVFNPSKPILSCKMPTGDRVQILGFDTVASGFAMAIRKANIIDRPLASFGISPQLAIDLKTFVEQKKNILVSGGTGTGKTSLTNQLIKFIPADDRVISIEGVRELVIPHRNQVAMVYSENESSRSGVNANDLLRASLRCNPWRLLIGEIHNENAMTFANAINSGHAGSLATIHANNPKAALVAIIQKIIVGGAGDAAINVLQRQLCKDIFGVVQITKNFTTGERTAYFETFEQYLEDTSIEKATKLALERGLDE